MEKAYTNENRRLALAAKAAGAGNRILDVLGGLLILLMLLYGGYYLWATWQIYDAAFLDDELLSYKPAVSEDGTNPTLSELAAINPDVCAWITIDDTNIDYPVVRCTDNLEYINKNVYGEFSLSGAIFFDSSTSADLSDAYLLLFGHHVTGGGMFGNVTDYLDEEYFRTHTTGNLFLPEETFAIEIFAAAEVDASDEVIYNPAAWDEENIADLEAYIREIAVQYREVSTAGDEDAAADTAAAAADTAETEADTSETEAASQTEADTSETDTDTAGADTAGSRIIGLSTCADATSNDRVVVFGWLKQE